MTPTERWSVQIAPPAQRALQQLPEKIATAIIETFEHIAKDPYRVGKPLKLEFEGLWSARRGGYRVIYATDAKRQMINIVAVGHRADIYRRRQSDG